MHHCNFMTYGQPNFLCLLLIPVLKMYICFIDFVELDSLTKTKNSLKVVKGQLKEEVEEKKTLTKTIQDLQSINTEVSILRPEDSLLHG